MPSKICFNSIALPTFRCVFEFVLVHDSNVKNFDRYFSTIWVFLPISAHWCELPLANGGCLYRRFLCFGWNFCFSIWAASSVAVVTAGLFGGDMGSFHNKCFAGIPCRGMWRWAVLCVFERDVRLCCWKGLFEDGWETWHALLLIYCDLNYPKEKVEAKYIYHTLD